MDFGWNMETLTAGGLLLIALSMVWSELWPYLKRLYLFILLFPKARRMERSYLFLAYKTGKLTRRQYWCLANRRKIVYGPPLTFWNRIQPLVWDEEKEQQKNYTPLHGVHDLYWLLQDLIQEDDWRCQGCDEPLRNIGDIRPLFRCRPDGYHDEHLDIECTRCGGRVKPGFSSRMSREKVEALVKPSSGEEWDRVSSVHPKTALQRLREITERSKGRKKA